MKWYTAIMRKRTINMIYRPLPTFPTPFYMLLKYRQFGDWNLVWLTTESKPFLLWRSYPRKPLVSCFACHWSRHRAWWSCVCGPGGGQRGRNGSTHLDSHQGPIRKFTPIWFGESCVFSSLFMLTMKVTLIYNSVGWSREGGFYGWKRSIKWLSQLPHTNAFLTEFQNQEAEGHRI